MISRVIRYPKTMAPISWIRHNSISRIKWHACYSFTSQLPKGSNFSSFMGLNKDLEELRKKQIKTENSETRITSFFVVIAIVLVGSAVGLLISDQDLRFRAELLLAETKLHFSKAKQSKRSLVEQIMLKVTTYNQQHPYEYKPMLSILLTLTQEAKSINDTSILSQLAQLYSSILKRNLRAGENKMFVRCISNLTQVCYLAKVQVSRQLVDMLLINGSIKQCYLGLLYSLHFQDRLQQILTNRMLLECLQKNLRQKIKQSSDYYRSITEERLKEDYPQIQFKKTQEYKWIAFIQEKLGLDLKQ